MCFGAEEGLDWRLDPEERRVEGRRGIGVGSGDMSIVHPGDGWSNDFCILIFFYIFDLFCHFLILGVRASMLVMGGQLFLVDNLKVSPASIKHVNFSHVIPIKLIMSSPIHLSSFQNC